MGLKQYRAKRNFTRTTEPAAPRSVRSQTADRQFVVQKHAARRLHYDLRLEMEGVLKSWAVPKGFPVSRGEKTLAVQVEDHPIEYANFEGIIPEGNYGAGSVMVWDKGQYEVLGAEPLEALESGKLHLRLRGEKLEGEWTLVRMRSAKAEAKENWLLIKSGESIARISARVDDRSVQTGRTMKAIAREADARWESNREAPPARKKQALKVPGLPRLPKAKPRFIPPMLCLSRKELPEGPEWTYEIKFDGYRVLAIKEENNRVELLTRNQKRVTSTFPAIREAVELLPCQEAVLDGEIVALDEEGKSSFQLLQTFQVPGARKPPLAYYAFDLPILNGRDLMGLPLCQRKEMLEPLVSGSSLIFHSAGLDAEPSVLINEIRSRGLEGLIAKKRESAYESGRRTGAWIKFKLGHEQEFVIGGYTQPEGSRDYFGALLVGYYKDGELLFASRVGTGFNQRLLGFLYEKFQPLARSSCPFVNLPQKRSGRWGQGLSPSDMKRCVWVEPKLVAQVRFTEWTRDGNLRHPVFLGLREDKSPREVTRNEV
jgi:bifunctional non-homologous end joining protein LigD